MASAKQTQAARRNVKRAQRAAASKRTIARREGIAGRSRMGSWELIDAIRASR